ncbi:MAG: hypothetical protein HYX95_03505 [Chloroflexi bacterium]|nr:hypothetical protein [Chloroflexota bacterium]
MTTRDKQDETSRNGLCKGTRTDRAPCGANATKSGYCPVHDPDRQAEMDAARRRGGRNHKNTARALSAMPPSLRAITEDLATAMSDVRNGNLKPSQAQAMASLASAYVRALQAGTAELVEERVKRLEEIAEQIANRGHRRADRW